MKLKNRISAAVDAFRQKDAGSEKMTIEQLIDFLGISGTKPQALSEATYFACIKVLSESVGKLPLKIQKYAPDQGMLHPIQQSLPKK